MRTRYIIIIITCLSFIPISIVFPQVFLIFHLDKYETNKTCDAINGEWDWFYNTCELSYKDRSFERLACEDIGATTTCRPCYPEAGYSPWPRMWSYGCLDMCREICEWKDGISSWTGTAEGMEKPEETWNLGENEN